LLGVDASIFNLSNNLKIIMSLILGISDFEQAKSQVQIFLGGQVLATKGLFFCHLALLRTGQVGPLPKAFQFSDPRADMEITGLRASK
jgi:hypothetical protein